jgi:hypothetical protein
VEVAKKNMYIVQITEKRMLHPSTGFKEQGKGQALKFSVYGSVCVSQLMEAEFEGHRSGSEPVFVYSSLKPTFSIQPSIKIGSLATTCPVPCPVIFDIQYVQALEEDPQLKSESVECGFTSSWLSMLAPQALFLQ